MGIEHELSQRDDEWQRRATAAAVAATQRVAAETIPAGTPVAQLSSTEWGWIVVAAIFAWIATRAEQATAEGLDTERAIRVTGFARGEPWDAGAVAAILPELGEDTTIDWTKPLSDWPRETMVDFLLKSLTLVGKAREASAILNDPVPF